MRILHLVARSQRRADTGVRLRDPEPFAALDRRTAARELREELGTAE